MKESVLLVATVTVDYLVFIGAFIAAAFAFIYGIETENTAVAVIWAISVFWLVAYLGDMIVKELLDWYWRMH